MVVDTMTKPLLQHLPRSRPQFGMWSAEDDQTGQDGTAQERPEGHQGQAGPGREVTAGRGVDGVRPLGCYPQHMVGIMLRLVDSVLRLVGESLSLLVRHCLLLVDTGESP